MKLFFYKAYDEFGNVESSTQYAKDQKSLYKRLESIGLYPVSCKRVSVNQFSKRKLSNDDLHQFFLHLFCLSQSGVSLIDSLKSIAEQNIKSHKSLAYRLIFEISHGATFSEALHNQKYLLSKVHIKLIESAEISGNLTDPLQDIVRSLEWQKKQMRNILSMLSYPVILIFALVICLYCISAFLIPQFVALFESLKYPLPTHTRITIEIFRFFGDHIVSTIVVIIIISVPIVTASALSNNVSVSIHQFLLSPFGLNTLYKNYLIVTLLHQLALLTKSKISLIDAISASVDTSSNKYICLKMQHILNNIKHGGNISDCFEAVGIFPPMITRMLEVSQQTGDIANPLHYAVTLLNTEIEASIKRKLKYLPLLFTFSFSALVLWIVTALFMPLYQLTPEIY